jgi:membrane protein DedA with SNARE-associated domain
VSVITSVIDEILKLHGLPAYALVGGLAFGEAALFIGFVLPGETAVLLGGVLANQHRVSLPVIAAVAVLAAIIGDSVGYEVGRHFGNRLLTTRIFANHGAGIERGRTMLHNYGGRAVFLARATAFLRAVMPGLAGTARMPYLRFLAFNAAGGLLWALGFTLLGYAVGAGYHEAEKVAGRASEVILGLVVVAAVALFIRHRRREKAEEREHDQAHEHDQAPEGRNGQAPEEQNGQAREREPAPGRPQDGSGQRDPDPRH